MYAEGNAHCTPVQEQIFRKKLNLANILQMFVSYDSRSSRVRGLK